MTNKETQRKISLMELLLCPFTYIAGGKALLAGIAAIALGGVICFFGNCHFDGLLDAHFGSIVTSSFWMYFSEGFINWVVIALLITVSARIVAKSSYRMLDVFGTIALARLPYILIALFSLLPGVGRYARYTGLKMLNAQPAVAPTPLDAGLFYLSVLVMIVVLIWTLILMYRAFSISCNATGKKAVIYFIIIVLLGEIISKLAIIGIAGLLSGGSGAPDGLA